VDAGRDAGFEEHVGQRLVPTVDRHDEGGVAHRITRDEQARICAQEISHAIGISCPGRLQQLHDCPREIFV
jgi:hypothetical protein